MPNEANSTKKLYLTRLERGDTTRKLGARNEPMVPHPVLLSHPHNPHLDSSINIPRRLHLYSSVLAPD